MKEGGIKSDSQGNPELPGTQNKKQHLFSAELPDIKPQHYRMMQEKKKEKIEREKKKRKVKQTFSTLESVL